MKIFLTTFTLLVIAWAIIGSPFIFGDGYGYYHAGKALAEKGSFTTEEKPEYYNYTGHGVIEYQGKFITPYTVGNALIWLPLLGLYSNIESGSTTSDYYYAFNGHSLLDGIVISLSAITLASLSVLLIYESLQILGFSKRISYFSVTTTFLGSFTLPYTIINASYSHIYEVFIFSLIIYLCLKLRSNKFEKIKYKNGAIILIGSLVGLLFLIRPFDILLLLPIGIFLLKKFRAKALLLILGGIPFALIFFSYNLASYGSILTTGYSLSDGFVFIFNLDRLIQLLFSDIRGWYIYSPLIFISTVGLFIINKQKKDLILLTLAPLAAILFGYSFWQNWWAGDSAGQRFLIVLLPIITLGTASFINHFKRRKTLLAIAVSLLSVYSLLLFILYRFTPTNIVGENRADYQYINSYERFGVSDIIKYHIKKITGSNSLYQYVNSLSEGLTGGRSVLMISLGLTKPIINVENYDNDISIYIIPTPTKQNTNSNILVTYKTEESITYYSLKSINANHLFEIEISCKLNCSSKNYDLTKLEEPMDTSDYNVKEIKLKQGVVYLYIPNDLKLASPIRKI